MFTADSSDDCVKRTYARANRTFYLAINSYDTDKTRKTVKQQSVPCHSEKKRTDNRIGLRAVIA